ncbi:Crp/Fnr family transcriptional regulator [Gemella sp. GH3]|uniref:Crp/Fnr family transcriptional regulator n=1 Tax=unclassified Gemella TaxID=2624949 RepID=UPI0015D01D57|nr:MULTISPECIES: Crp/Fnr family transcriptional regulator [unclassified Gemella]MBF0714434.1 Crp/Fnr family transcriptional regulator [Gemella sp. GH3.1]NYS51386.1 Crp/Fnr family transcriptional regulator [Gemella sp. GH3]
MEKLFSTIHIFEGISEKSKEALRTIKRREAKYSSNDLVIESGEDIKEICIILEGVLRCTEFTNTGKSVNSSYYGPGVSFPFYMLYGGETKYSFDTYAIRKTKVVWFAWDDIKNIIENDIKFMKNVMIYIAEFTCYNQRILRALQYRRVKDRLVYWLVNINNPSITINIPISQGVLADILHVNRSTLNKELNLLQESGAISIGNKRIEVLDFQYLKDLL